ncbi:MAG: hypothetical protein LBI70_03590, partial [Rickettsiales bacterium]|nr:hypothetical protein [Rickettsiales bacterium]
MLDKIRFVAHMYKVVFVALFSVLLGNVEENKNLNIKSSIVSEEEAEQKVSVAFKKNMGAELEELKESVSAVDGGGKISSEKDEKELEEESKPIPAMENIINDPVLPLRSRTQEKNDDAPEKPASIDIPQRAEPIPAIPALNALEKPADIDIPQGA